MPSRRSFSSCVACTKPERERSGRQGYTPQSGEILGFLKRLKDEMSVDRVDAQKEEADPKADHAALITAEKKEVASLTVTTKASW